MRNNSQRRETVDQDKITRTAEEAGRLVGLSRWTIQAIKKASKGAPDSPFAGRFTTPRKIREWLFSHPDFVATRYMRKKSEDKQGQPSTVSDPQPSGACKFGGRSAKRGRRKPSPAGSERPLAQVA